MAATNLKYHLRVPEGKGKNRVFKEYGPIDQETLTQWAKNGRVTRESEVRNALLSQWQSVERVDFIKDIIIDPVAEAQRKLTWKDKFYAKLARTDEQTAKTASGGLHKAGRFKFDPAGPVQRLVAWVMDLAICGGIGALALLGSSFLVARGMLDEEMVFTGVTVFTILVYVWYMTIRIAFRAQTVGQWFWGIMVVRDTGDPVLAARALTYALWHVVFGVLTIPCTIVVPGGRAVQDFASGTRVVSIKVRSDS
jgi:uncharacterized RDD family membrane protein YckC